MKNMRAKISEQSEQLRVQVLSHNISYLRWVILEEEHDFITVIEPMFSYEMKAKGISAYLGGASTAAVTDNHRQVLRSRLCPDSPSISSRDLF